MMCRILDKEIKKSKKAINKLEKRREKHKKRSERRMKLQERKIQESERKHRQVCRQTNEYVQEVIKDYKFTPNSEKFSEDLEAKRQQELQREERIFLARYHEQGPWTRRVSRTVWRPSTRSDVGGVVLVPIPEERDEDILSLDVSEEDMQM